MRIAVLALQGAFAEQERMLQRIGCETFQVRSLKDWSRNKDALVLPGGESTVMMRLLHDLQLFDPIRNDIKDGLPALGTCAGMILLSKERLGTMDIEVKRNAYGRQLGSFNTTGDIEGVCKDYPMVFIRAPYIEKLSNDALPISKIDGNFVAARQGRQLALSFHPELTDDTRLHEYFIEKLCK